MKNCKSGLSREIGNINCPLDSNNESVYIHRQQLGNKTMQYLLFGYSSYYPAGGWDDYKEQFETIESALEYAANINVDGWQIVDIETKTIVKRGYRLD